MKNTKQIQKLVYELAKTNPDQNKVRKLMMDFGLEYSTDPITQMSVVLQALDRNIEKNADQKINMKIGKEI